MTKLVEVRQAISCKYLPQTNHKPARIAVKVGNFPKKIYSIPETSLNYDEVPQLIANEAIKELGLSWEISGAGFVDGKYIFTIK